MPLCDFNSMLVASNRPTAWRFDALSVQSLERGGAETKERVLNAVFFRRRHPKLDGTPVFVADRHCRNSAPLAQTANDLV